MLASNLEPLVEMGLTGLEAQTYAYLLENAPATGYGVAKGIGKPTANTYKAMEALYHRGAVIREESGNREYRPVAPEELLGALERQFTDRKERAAAELHKLQSTAEDDRVYRLNTPEQVLERLRHMLAKASHCIILDLFPQIVEVLAEDIEATADRGVKVIVKLYQPHKLKNVRTVLDANAGEVIERWSGQWANGVADGHQHLMAWLSNDATSVHQAIWSGSAFLSWVYHTALLNELLCSVVESALKSNQPSAEILEQFSEFRQLGFADNAPGYRALMEK